jgi:hypothetical protein
VPPGASLQETVDSPYEATPAKTNGPSKVPAATGGTR